MRIQPKIELRHDRPVRLESQFVSSFGNDAVQLRFPAQAQRRKERKNTLNSLIFFASCAFAPLRLCGSIYFQTAPVPFVSFFVGPSTKSTFASSLVNHSRYIRKDRLNNAKASSPSEGSGVHDHGCDGKQSGNANSSTRNNQECSDFAIPEFNHCSWCRDCQENDAIEE